MAVEMSPPHRIPEGDPIEPQRERVYNVLNMAAAAVHSAPFGFTYGLGIGRFDKVGVVFLTGTAEDFEWHRVPAARLEEVFALAETGDVPFQDHRQITEDDVVEVELDGRTWPIALSAFDRMNRVQEDYKAVTMREGPNSSIIYPCPTNPEEADICRILDYELNDAARQFFRLQKSGQE